MWNANAYNSCFVLWSTLLAQASCIALQPLCAMKRQHTCKRKCQQPVLRETYFVCGWRLTASIRDPEVPVFSPAPGISVWQPWSLMALAWHRMTWFTTAFPCTTLQVTQTVFLSIYLKKKSVHSTSVSVAPKPHGDILTCGCPGLSLAGGLSWVSSAFPIVSPPFYETVNIMTVSHYYALMNPWGQFEIWEEFVMFLVLWQ